MHFEYSATTHRWCGQCGANIRKDASWCRVCHKHIASKFLCNEQRVDPSVIVRAAALWLAKFDQLVSKCASGLKERLKPAESTATLGSKDATTPVGLSENTAPVSLPENTTPVRLSENICPEQPPEPQVAGLLQDILLHLHECGEDLENLCEDPRLLLLEITPAKIIEEAELRLQEQSSGKTCTFCQEFILSEHCRFCKSNGKDPLEDLTWRGLTPKLDSQFLAAVILWESARLQADSNSALPAEILASQQITSSALELEVARQRVAPNDFPMSRWRRRMLELNLKTERTFQETEMEDLLSLGLACTRESKDVEAGIVYRHGLRRLGVDTPLLLCKMRMIDGLAQVCMLRKDYENYHKLNEESRVLRLSVLPEQMRKLSTDSEKDRDSMLLRISENVRIDLRKQVEQSEELLKKLQDRHAQMMEHANPEIRKLMEAQRLALNKVAGPGIELAKLCLAAEDARKAGDFERAANLLEDALSRLGNEAADVPKRSSLLSTLANIQHLQGQNDLAAETFQRAISAGEELAELHQGQEYFPVGIACFGYAKFLMQTEHYGEAEKYFMRALEMDRKFQDRFDHNFRLSAPRASGMESNIKKELVKLLRLTDRAKQADEMELEVADIERRIIEREQRLANDRRNFLEMVSDEKRPETT